MFERKGEARIKRANTDWWINEKAVVGMNGMTYIAYVTDMGEIHVKEISAKCSLTPSRDICICRMNCNYSDEHNAPSICILENGRIMVAYTGHGATHTMKYRITGEPFDITTFGPERVLIYEKSITYAQLFENTRKHELWLFARVDGVTWEFRYSPDEGENWSKPTVFLASDAGGLFYFDIHKMTVPDNGELREQWVFALYGHPRISKDHTIRSGIFDEDGFLLTMDGERTGMNLYGKEKEGKALTGMLDLTKLAVVYASPAGTTVRLLAVSATRPYRVGLAAFVLNRPETAVYYSASWKQGSWRLSEPIRWENSSHRDRWTAPRPMWEEWLITMEWERPGFIPRMREERAGRTGSIWQEQTKRHGIWKAMSPMTLGKPMSRKGRSGKSQRRSRS